MHNCVVICSYSHKGAGLHARRRSRFVLLDFAKFYTEKVLKQALHSPLFTVSLVLNHVQNFFLSFFLRLKLICRLM